MGVNCHAINSIFILCLIKLGGKRKSAVSADLFSFFFFFFIKLQLLLAANSVMYRTELIVKVKKLS